MGKAGSLLVAAVAPLCLWGCAGRGSDCAWGPGEAAGFAQAAAMGPASRPARPGPVELTSRSSLREYLAYAVLNNAGLESAFSQWKAALEKGPQETAWPEPQFTYKYFILEMMMRDGEIRHVYQVTQAIPWLRRLELRGGMAGQEAAAGLQRFEALRLRVMFRVREAYYEGCLLERQIALMEQSRQLLQYAEEAVRARARAGLGQNVDVLSVQMEMGRLDSQLASMRAMRQAVRARLNAALGRPSAAEVNWAPLPQRVLNAAEKQLAAWLETGPELKTMEHEIARERQAVQLARTSYYPDFMLGVEYTQMVPGEFWQDPIAVMLQVSLPIWRDKYAASVREATWRSLAAQQQREQAARDLRAELRMALYRYGDALRRVQLNRDWLAPRGRESMQLNETAFRSGTGSFAMLIESYRRILEFSLEQERALADLATRLAEVEMLVGREVPRADLPTTMPSAATRPGTVTGPG